MKIGVIDTTFARVNMGNVALAAFARHPLGGARVDVVRVTVPGFKDLAPEARRLLDRDDCEIVLALGWSGGADLDGRSAMIAGQGLMLVKVLTGKHVLEAFIHVEESPDDEERLIAMCIDRVEGHVEHALMLAHDRFALVELAGSGRRQGEADVGALTQSGGTRGI